MQPETDVIVGGWVSEWVGGLCRWLSLLSWTWHLHSDENEKPGEMTGRQAEGYGNPKGK